MPPRAAGSYTHAEAAVSRRVVAGLVAPTVGVGGVDLAVDKDHVEFCAIGPAGFPAGQRGVPAEEVPAGFQVDEAFEAGLDGRDLGGELATPCLVGLLEP